MSGLLALTLGLGLSGTAFAAQDFSKKSPGYSSSFDTQMTKVMESGDFEAWKALVMSKTGKVDPLITKGNFAQFAEAWKLAKEGKIKEANVIRQELGLKTNKNVNNTDKDKDNDNDVSKIAGKDTDNDGAQMKAQNQSVNKIKKNKKMKKVIKTAPTASSTTTQ
ncbi:hypothetical protein HXX01_04525 [Candidatus Nomurabacteria bacterium]|nr:hypothetical protein [Candidatus Nomurabacteria bacterium]